MPAIHLARLKRQAVELAELFDQPSAFASRLDDLFEYYAERSHRPGQAGTPPPLLPAYKVPAPVLRRISLELEEPALADPQGALALADALWQRPNLEYRLLAARVLGMISPHPPEPVLARLEAWNIENQEDALLEALAGQGMARLRAEALERYLELLDEWLNSKELYDQKLGLRAMESLLEQPGFENLPVVLRLLGPRLEAATSALRPYLLEVLRTLADHSPQEAAYFLRQTLVRSDNKHTRWLTRRLLERFPPDSQARLREAMQG